MPRTYHAHPSTADTHGAELSGCVGLYVYRGMRSHFTQPLELG